MKNSGKYKCKLSMSRQRNEIKEVNYFIAIITVITEKIFGRDEKFNLDPRGLSYLLNNRKFIGLSSRKFDRAYLLMCNSKMVWEILFNVV